MLPAFYQEAKEVQPDNVRHYLQKIESPLGIIEEPCSPAWAAGQGILQNVGNSGLFKVRSLIPLQAAQQAAGNALAEHLQQIPNPTRRVRILKTRSNI
jgi:hypothetical protein